MAKYVEIEYKDLFLNTWRVDIFDDNYTELEPIKPTGFAVVKRPKTKLMEVIKGSSLEINLDANLDSDFYTRFTETIGDKKFKVEFYKNENLYWTGFLKPDGVIESFVTDKWLITITAVDGLGYLKNIEFKDENDELYRGSQNEKLLLERCLVLTGLELKYRIYDIQLEFTVNADSTFTGLNKKPINDTYVNAERYIENDLKKTVFDSEKVLKAILAKYGCFIFQEDGVWKIQRVKDLMTIDTNNYAYNEYDFDGAFLVRVASNSVLKTLGSQIDNFTTYHANGDQIKTYNSAIGAYKVIFNYGLAKSILNNSTLTWDTETTIAEWTPQNLGFFDNETLTDGSINSFFLAFEASFILNGLLIPKTLAIASIIDPSDVVTAGNTLEVEFNATVTQTGKRVLQYAQVILEALDNSNVYYLTEGGEWTNNDQTFIKAVDNEDLNAFTVIGGVTTETSYKIDTQSIPETGNIVIRLYRPAYDKPVILVQQKNQVRINNIRISGANLLIKGESWTAKRQDVEIAVVENKLDLAVGDQSSDIYIGGIEDFLGRNTFFWRRVGDVLNNEVHPLLFWLAFDRLKLAYGNGLEFSGSIYGEPLPFSGKLNINNIDGNFITLEYTYNTRTGVINATHLRVFDDPEINPQDEIFVEFNIEGENVVEPAINP